MEFEESPSAPRGARGRKGENRSGFEAAWVNTRRGRRLLIRTGDTKVWLSAEEAKKLAKVILDELL